MTSTARAEPSRGSRLTTHGFRASSRASLSRRLGVALRRKRSAHDRLVRINVDHGPNADARRVDDVDGVDADARTDVGRLRRVVSRHVDRDDGGDDAAILGAHAAAVPPGRRRDRRDAPRRADRAGERRVLLRVDRVRNGRLSARRHAGGSHDAVAGAGACRSDHGRCDRPDRRPAPVHRVEGTSPCLLPRGTGVLPSAVGRPHRLAARPAPRTPLQLLLRRPDGNPSRHRGHGPARDGCRGLSHHRRAPCPTMLRSMRCTSHERFPARPLTF
jgi:hypothetical protein